MKTPRTGYTYTQETNPSQTLKNVKIFQDVASHSMMFAMKQPPTGIRSVGEGLRPTFVATSALEPDAARRIFMRNEYAFAMLARC